MRVALVEVWGRGGTARHAAELASGLARTGCGQSEVHLLAPEDFEDEPAGYELRRMLPTMQGMRHGGLVGRAYGMLRQRNRQISMVLEQMEQIRPHVVHLLGTPLAARNVFRKGRALGCKVVLSVHDIPRARRGYAQLLLAAWSKDLVEADGIVVHGEWSRRELIEAYGAEITGRVSVIPAGIYDEGRPSGSRAEIRVRYGLPAQKPVLLFFGAIRADKGLDLLIRAMADEPSGNLHLLVAGARPSRAEPPLEYYKAEAKNRGIDGRITWMTDYLPAGEIPDLMTSSDAVLLPYRRHFGGQSGVLNTAVHYNTPVIASDVGDIGPTVREYGLGITVEAEAHEPLVAALSQLGAGTLSWPPRRDTEYQQYAGWTQVARRTWGLYEEILK